MKRSNRSLLVLVAVCVLALHAGIATAQTETESFETRSIGGIRSQGTDVNPEGSGNVLIITGPNPATTGRNPATIERNPATTERNPATSGLGSSAFNGSANLRVNSEVGVNPGARGSEGTTYDAPVTETATRVTPATNTDASTSTSTRGNPYAGNDRHPGSSRHDRNSVDSRRQALETQRLLGRVEYRNALNMADREPLYGYPAILGQDSGQSDNSGQIDRVGAMLERQAEQAAAAEYPYMGDGGCWYPSRFTPSCRYEPTKPKPVPAPFFDSSADDDQDGDSADGDDDNYDEEEGAFLETHSELTAADGVEDDGAGSGSPAGDKAKDGKKGPVVTDADLNRHFEEQAQEHAARADAYHENAKGYRDDAADARKKADAARKKADAARTEENREWWKQQADAYDDHADILEDAADGSDAAATREEAQAEESLNHANQVGSTQSPSNADPEQGAEQVGQVDTGASTVDVVAVDSDGSDLVGSPSNGGLANAGTAPVASSAAAASAIANAQPTASLAESLLPDFAKHWFGVGHRESTLVAGLGGLRDGLHDTFVKGDNWLNKGYQRNEKDWFGRDGRDSTIVAGLGAFVDGLHDTFVKGDNWLNRWYQKKEWQLEKAADASVARGNGMLDTFGVLLATAIGVDDLFGVGDRSNTMEPMIVGFVDGLPDVFYHGDNWAHRAYEAEAEHLDNAAELFGERGDTTAEAFFGLGGVIISDAAGTTELYEAGSDQDLVAFVEDGNHHDLTDEEQILKGVTGGVKLVGAGMQGAGWSQSVRTAITASRIGTLEAQAAAKAAQLGNSAKLTNSTRPVLSGHGSGLRGTTFQNPNNVTVRFHSGYSKPLDNIPANYIEMGIGTGPATRVYGPGQEVPEHMLYAIKESWVIRGPGVQTVTQPTKLSDLITQLAKDNPGQQIVVEWAACRGVIDDVAERVAGTIVVMAASGCSDEIAGVGDGTDQTTLIR